MWALHIELKVTHSAHFTRGCPPHQCQVESSWVKLMQAWQIISKSKNTLYSKLSCSMHSARWMHNVTHIWTNLHCYLQFLDAQIHIDLNILNCNSWPSIQLWMTAFWAAIEPVFAKEDLPEVSDFMYMKDVYKNGISFLCFGFVQCVHLRTLLCVFSPKTGNKVWCTIMVSNPLLKMCIAN